LGDLNTLLHLINHAEATDIEKDKSFDDASIPAQYLRSKRWKHQVASSGILVEKNGKMAILEQLRDGQLYPTGSGKQPGCDLTDFMNNNAHLKRTGTSPALSWEQNSANKMCLVHALNNLEVALLILFGDYIFKDTFSRTATSLSTGVLAENDVKFAFVLNHIELRLAKFMDGVARGHCKAVKGYDFDDRASIRAYVLELFDPDALAALCVFDNYLRWQVEGNEGAYSWLALHNIQVNGKRPREEGPTKEDAIRKSEQAAAKKLKQKLEATTDHVSVTTGAGGAINSSSPIDVVRVKCCQFFACEVLGLKHASTEAKHLALLGNPIKCTPSPGTQCPREHPVISKAFLQAYWHQTYLPQFCKALKKEAVAALESYTD